MWEAHRKVEVFTLHIYNPYRQIAYICKSRDPTTRWEVETWEFLDALNQARQPDICSGKITKSSSLWWDCPLTCVHRTWFSYLHWPTPHHCSWSGVVVCLLAWFVLFDCLFCFIELFFFFSILFGNKDSQCNPSLLQISSAILCYYPWLPSLLWISSSLPISWRAEPGILSWRVQSSIHSSLIFSHIAFPFLLFSTLLPGFILHSPERLPSCAGLTPLLSPSGYRILGQLHLCKQTLPPRYSENITSSSSEPPVTTPAAKSFPCCWRKQTYPSLYFRIPWLAPMPWSWRNEGLVRTNGMNEWQGKSKTLNSTVLNWLPNFFSPLFLVISL